jgi:hypothetical protein
MSYLSKTARPLRFGRAAQDELEKAYDKEEETETTETLA